MSNWWSFFFLVADPASSTEPAPPEPAPMVVCEERAAVCEERTKPLGFVSLKFSYFYPQDKNFRHLYGGGFLPLAELGFMLGERFFLSMESGYFHKEKRISDFDSEKFASSITVIPTSLYLGYIFAHGDFWELYLKAGPNGVYAKTHVSIPNLPPNKHKWAWGGSFGGGAKFYFDKNLFAEAFLQYLYDKTRVKDGGDHFSVYLGGLVAGGAVGYRF